MTSKSETFVNSSYVGLDVEAADLQSFELVWVSDAVIAYQARLLRIHVIFLIQELLDLGYFFCELLIGRLQFVAARTVVSVEFDDGWSFSLFGQQKSLTVEVAAKQEWGVARLYMWFDEAFACRQYRCFNVGIVQVGMIVNEF